MKNKDDKCFLYVVNFALNYGEIESNIKMIIKKYKLKGIYYPSKIDDWKTFDKINQKLLLIFIY